VSPEKQRAFFQEVQGFWFRTPTQSSLANHHASAAFGFVDLGQRLTAVLPAKTEHS